MRVMSLKALMVLSIAALYPTLAQAGAGHYSVELNKTEVVYLPSTAGAVVIGNPSIADISVHSANTIFVVGRGYGETNLIVLDAEGQKIMDADIQVVNNLPAHGVRLYNGSKRQTYNCAPYCQPAPVLGDTTGFLSKNRGSGKSINNNVASGSPTQPFSPAPTGNSEPPTLSGGAPPPAQ